MQRSCVLWTISLTALGEMTERDSVNGDTTYNRPAASARCGASDLSPPRQQNVEVSESDKVCAILGQGCDKWEGEAGNT